MKQLYLVATFFILLALASLTGFPGDYFAEPQPRGLRTLDFILSLFAGESGRVVGALRILGLGAVVVGLGYLRLRRAEGSNQGDRLAGGAIGQSPATPARRRMFGKAAAAEETPRPTSTKGEIARLMGAAPDSAEANDMRLADASDYGALTMAIVEANLPTPPPEGPLDPAIEAGWSRAIVFRQTFPPSDDASLSFYGGAPVGPADLDWPRAADGTPLTFIMQCYCPDIAEHDPTGLFPKEGALWFFMDLTWGEAENFAFVHRTGPTDGWSAIAPPGDLPAVYGKDGAYYMPGCTTKVDDAERFVPRLLPWQPFVPMGIDTVRRSDDDSDGADDDEPKWTTVHLSGQSLLDAQNSVGEPLPVEPIDQRKAPFGRPFPQFPHDFGAIRILAATVIDEVGSRMFEQRKGPLQDLEPEERAALASGWVSEATELYLFAADRDPAEPVDRALADQVWAWAVACEPAFGWKFEEAVINSVDASFANRSRATSAIPQAWIARAAKRHLLASQYDRWEHPDRKTPGAYESYEERKARGELAVIRETHVGAVNQMFGAPSYVQGDVEELVYDHVLLLELQSGGAPGHHFGEGVLQYLIRPEDLAAGRFDRVKPVLSAY